MGIGLIFLFALFSLLVSALQEILEGLLQRRTINLHEGIDRLVKQLNQSDGANKLSAETLYNSKLIAPLFAGDYQSEKGSKRNLPAYIAPEVFAKAAAELMPDAMKSSGELISATEKEIEALYVAMTDRLSAVYRRNTQRALFCLGLAAAVFINFDTIRVAESLYENPGLRAVVVADAEAAANDAESYFAAVGCEDADDAESRQQCTRDRLGGYGLPLGWDNSPLTSDTEDVSAVAIGSAILGWLLSALAICLGASFWFDLLNKVINFRSTLRPKPSGQ